MLSTPRRRNMKDNTKQTIRAIGELIGSIFTLLLFALLFWLFIVATPDQLSAECELVRWEMKHSQIFTNTIN